MKALCSLFAFLVLATSAPAATNTLYTTTTNKVIAITATGKSVIEATNAAAARTALSITNATGLEATAANLTTVSNSVTTLQTQLPGYATNLGALATNFTAYGLTINTGSTNNSLTASRAVVTDANKGIVSSTVTGTELGYVSGVTSALQTQLDAKATAANLTTVSNSVTSQGNTLATNTALLNGTNVLTGTNNFTGTVLITNAASTISGNGAGLTNISDAALSANVGLLGATNQAWTGTNTFTAASFFPANMIGRRLLWSSHTNYYFPTLVTNAGNLTNAGDFSSLTSLARATIPPLLGKNSHLVFYYTRWNTNANASAAQINVYVGAQTNFVGCFNNFMQASAGRSSAVGIGLLHAGNSYTQQFGGASFQVGAQLTYQPTNYCDTSVSNTIYLGLFTTTSHLGLNIAGLAIFEDIVP